MFAVKYAGRSENSSGAAAPMVFGGLPFSRRQAFGFTHAPEHALEETAGAVIDGLYDNAAFATPPVLKPALMTALGDFTTAIAAQAQGGTAVPWVGWASRPPRRRRGIVAEGGWASMGRASSHGPFELRGGSIAKIRASNVRMIPARTRESAGGTPTLPKATIKDILNGNSGQILLRVKPVKNAKAYEVRYALSPLGGTPGTWQSGGLFTNSRSMPVNGLTPGSSYSFQVRAIGGSTGYSDWSNPVGHMSM